MLQTISVGEINLDDFKGRAGSGRDWQGRAGIGEDGHGRERQGEDAFVGPRQGLRRGGDGHGPASRGTARKGFLWDQKQWPGSAGRGAEWHGTDGIGVAGIGKDAFVGPRTRAGTGRDGKGGAR